MWPAPLSTLGHVAQSRATETEGQRMPDETEGTEPTTTVETKVETPAADPNRDAASEQREERANEASHKARDENAAK